MSEFLDFIASTDFLMAAGLFASGAILGSWMTCKIADWFARRERSRVKHPYLFD